MVTNVMNDHGLPSEKQKLSRLGLLFPLSFWISFWPQSRKGRSGSFTLSSLRMGRLRHKESQAHFSRFAVSCRVRLELKSQILILGSGTELPVSLRNKLNCVNWNLFCSVSDPASLLAKRLGLMNSISSGFPEVPLAKPCASYTGVTWWLHTGGSRG